MSLLHLVNDGSFAVRGGPGWVNGSSANGDKPAATADDQLANVLRESLARVEKPIMPTKEQIETAIAEARGAIEKELALAIRKRDEAAEYIKRLRAELAAAPRLHVPRKYKKNEALMGTLVQTGVVAGIPTFKVEDPDGTRTEADERRAGA